MSQSRVIALGFFDGVHLGHAALLNRTAEIARQKGLAPAVLSFDEHPLSRVRGTAVPLLSRPEERSLLFREVFGIEETIILHFDSAMMHMPWEEFLTLLEEEYQVAHIVCGHDYSCGYMGRGKAEQIADHCQRVGLGCDIIPPVEVDGLRVSSSLIRQCITEGDMDQANRLYGHPHLMTGLVRTGKKLGRTIDAPTINLRFERDVIVPRHGVYAAMVTLPDGRRLPGVTNVGVRPTVEDTDIVNAETFILDYSGNLYGQPVRLEFYHFLRPEMKFNSVDELKARIHADAASVAEYFKMK